MPPVERVTVGELSIAARSRQYVGRALLELGVAAGDAVAARRWLMIRLAESKAPEITLEI